MTIRIHLQQPGPARRQQVLAWAGRVLVGLGSLLLAFCALTYFEAAWFQKSEGEAFEKLMVPQPVPGVEPKIQSQHNPDPGELARPKQLEAVRAAPLAEGSPLSRIEIPRLGVSVIVVEGVKSRDLKLAVGHIPGTALPGESGNIGIAGHRDTFFRKLGQIHPQDKITLTTSKGRFDFAVESTQIVEPTDTRVLQASTDSILTLVTCYPFYYVGPAPKRFIVTARRTEF